MSALIEGVAHDLAATVRARRKELGWSQHAMAKRMSALLPNRKDPARDSWHQTTVAKLESGSRTVTVQELVALAAALSFPRLQDLFGDSSAIGDALLANWTARERQRVSTAADRAMAMLAEVNPAAAAVMRDAFSEIEATVYDGDAKSDEELQQQLAAIQAQLSRRIEERGGDRGVDREA